MFVNVSALPSGVPCSIVGYGHTDLSDDPRFRQLTQEEFITEKMSPTAIRELLGLPPPWPEEVINEVASKWVSQTGIGIRSFYDGMVQDLAVIAARKCLAQAKVDPEELDFIIGGSNTGPGYPSLADYVKLGLGKDSEAAAFDVAEACPVGCFAVYNGWLNIRAGVAKKVLVVCAEKATTLAPYDEWKGSNLFGDAAFAFLLVASEQESFRFFDMHSRPFGGKIDWIKKTANGFSQNGLLVHRFVVSEVPSILDAAVARAEIDPVTIRHLVPHQPSAKTLDSFLGRLANRWPTFVGLTHRNVETTGNTSGASTGSLISRGIQGGVIKPSEMVVVTTFGSGMSIGNYGFIV